MDHSPVVVSCNAPRDALLRAVVVAGVSSPSPWTNGRPTALGCGPAAMGCVGTGGSGGPEVLVDEPGEAMTALHRAGRDGDHVGRWAVEALTVARYSAYVGGQ